MPYDNDYNNWDNVDHNEDLNNEKNSMKMMDKGYNKTYTKIQVQTNNSKKKNKYIRKRIEFYTTGTVGSRIRDATTGYYYNETVGTKNEGIYFKVALSNGICESGNNSNTCYFISPSQYTNHFGMHDLDTEVINKWETRRSELLDYN